MVRFREASSALYITSALTLVLSLIYWPATLLGFFCVAFTLFFFRDPERHAESTDNSIISPADGTVLYVEDLDDVFVGKSKRVAIFMSAFDVHVNRSPINGVFKSIQHTPGKKVAAYLLGDLNARERNRCEIEGDINVAMIQYAGVFARRIVFFKTVGDSAQAGERVGMIKFGSRVDVIAPFNAEIKVVKGQKVTAGETVLGEYDA